MLTSRAGCPQQLLGPPVVCQPWIGQSTEPPAWPAPLPCLPFRLPSLALSSSILSSATPHDHRHPPKPVCLCKGRSRRVVSGRFDCASQAADPPIGRPVQSGLTLGPCIAYRRCTAERAREPITSRDPTLLYLYPFARPTRLHARASCRGAISIDFVCCSRRRTTKSPCQRSLALRDQPSSAHRLLTGQDRPRALSKAWVSWLMYSPLHP